MIYASSSHVALQVEFSCADKRDFLYLIDALVFKCCDIRSVDKSRWSPEHTAHVPRVRAHMGLRDRGAMWRKVQSLADHLETGLAVENNRHVDESRGRVIG